MIALAAQALLHTWHPLHFSLTVYVSSAWHWWAGHRRFAMCASYSDRKYLRVVSTGFGAVWPRPHSELFLTRAARFSSFSTSPSSPLPSVMRTRISSIRLVPTRQNVHFPQDSRCVKSRKNRATSTMHVVSSRTTSPPEPMIAPVLLMDS